jgi:hypothetical protein
MYMLSLKNSEIYIHTCTVCMSLISQKSFSPKTHFIDAIRLMKPILQYNVVTASKPLTYLNEFLFAG